MNVLEASPPPAPSPVAPASARRVRWWTVALAAIALASLGLRARHLGGPPLGPHSFRQTQTAFTVQAWLDRGFTILHYETPVFGPPWQVPFELPFFQASAYVLARAGLPVDLACRLMALAWFYASAALLVVLARRYLGEVAAVVSFAAYALTPFSVLWSRSILIDYASVALALGYLLATAAWVERRGAAAWVLAVALGALATTTKVTTVPAVAAGLAIVAVVALRRAQRQGAAELVRTAIGLGGVAGIPLAAVLLWTRWADAVKAASPATEWVTSKRLSDWNFGTLRQRLDPHAWDGIGSRLKFILPGLLGVLVALAAVALWRRTGAARAAIAAAFAGAVLPVLVFFNLHVVHDYYQIAVTPALALLAGAGAAELASLRFRGRAAVLGLAGAAVIASSLGSFRYARPAWQDLERDPVVPLARLVADATPPDRWIVVEGDDWSPVIPYLSHRLAFMVRPPFVPVTLLADRSQVGTVVCKECPRDLLDRWPTRRLAGREAGFRVYVVSAAPASLARPPPEPGRAGF